MKILKQSCNVLGDSKKITASLLSEAAERTTPSHSSKEGGVEYGDYSQVRTEPAEWAVTEGAS